MVPGGAPGDNSFEGDLTTSSLEQRTRTFDVAPAARAGIAGPATGDVLKNRFVLHQCLAEGSTSRLFRALDRRREAAGDPDPWVVLKVVTTAPAPADGGSEPRALQALRREAAIAQGLEHPNLPRIIGIDHDGPHTFVCMAWLEGESLAAILDSRGTRPMTRVQALHIVEGVGRALMHLHGQGITHADVKPGNILVTAQGDATLLDFGVAVGPGAGDLPAVRGFTPEYASPEVLAGSEATAADDLFSLACVAYRMLGGRRAFGPVTAREAAAAGSRPPRPEHLSPAQWRALDRALSFERADRQADVATLLAQLKGARDESLAITDLTAAEPDLALTPAATSGPAAPTARTLPALAALLIIVAIVGSGGAWWVLRTPDPVTAGVPVAPAPEKLRGSDPPSPAIVPDTSPPAEAAVPAPGAVAANQAQPAPAAAARPSARIAAARPLATPAQNRSAPVELAGPPLPEPEDLATAAPAPAAGAVADTTSAVRAVAYSSLTVRRYVEPDYPRNAAARRVPGWVDVAFTVEPSGKTRDVRVIGAEPPEMFDDAALAAVRRWRFAELDAGGGAAAGPVSSQIRVRFDPR